MDRREGKRVRAGESLLPAACRVAPSSRLPPSSQTPLPEGAAAQSPASWVGTGTVTPTLPMSSPSLLLMVLGPSPPFVVSCHPLGTSDKGGFGSMCWGNGRCCREQLHGCNTASGPHACRVPMSPAAASLGQGRWM